MIEVICNCGKIFKTYEAWIRKGAGVNCSKACSYIYKKKAIKTLYNKKCKECNKEFVIRKGYGGTGDYCSNICRAIGCGKLLRSDNHPFWNNGSSKRTYSSRRIIRQAIELKKQCENCYSKDQLHGHHILSYAKYPELRSILSNIKVLCVNCHSNEHPKFKKFILKGIDNGRKMDKGNAPEKGSAP